MPKVDLESLTVIARTSYPPPHDRAVEGRSWLDIAEAVGLSQFGANLCTLTPGAWSSQRHWHSAEDEMVVVLSGELVLVEDDGEAILTAGHIATFKAGEANGHHLQNRSAEPATFLAIGPNNPEIDVCTYPDIGLVLDRRGYRFTL
ncbi:cupin domain-containing protein [Sandaracinobacteroides hominis]|uniref:cupin domain-containing protein n=1 Tax=Sandaracinobacteroides hominis TaxID=2780086 RepID=UPI0018F54EEC|nr:cupin domain-containing protein [Sandaracinobacteroides hominis]